MGKLVSVTACSHAPGQTRAAQEAGEDAKKIVGDAWQGLKQSIEESRPDVIIGISNDHFRNFPFIVPPFCVGTGETHTMPGARQAKWLKLRSKEMKGHPAFSEYLIRFADSTSFPLAFSDALEFVDEFSVPMHFLGIHETRFVPIFTNCLHRNRPSPRTFLALGRVLADAVAKFPQDLRVALLATGGLSHDPHGPRWGLVDEAFDRRFLSLLEAGQTSTLLEEFTLEKILEPGKGGTPELLNWFVALGAAGSEARAKILGYTAVPEWSTGMGYVDWQVDKKR
jgi:hypothetical protein